MVKRLLIIFLVISQRPVLGQTIYDWDQNAPDGNWKQGAGGARWQPGGYWDEPPYGILRFNNNSQLNMTNNVTGTFGQHQIIFGSSGTSNRTIGGNPVRLSDFSGADPKIENQSTGSHTINFALEGDGDAGDPLELNPVSGNLTFGGTINNRGSSILIYGDNTKSIQFNDIISGSGAFVIKQNSLAKFNASNTYTGNTEIDKGELWIESSGSISASSAIYLGNGGLMANVAKLWLSNSTGGTTFSNNVTVNPGNTTTRYLGGLNTSGTHTFSGNITNNSTNGLYLKAYNSGGTTTFSGVISGSNAVIAEGDGTLIFSGSGDNTFTGLTTVNCPLLILNKTAGKKAVGNNLTIATGKVVRTDADNQFGTGTPALVTIEGTGDFNCNNTNQKIALVSSSSSAEVILGSGTLTIYNTMTDTYAGVISGTGGVTKSGSGTEILTGANTYTGTTTISGGTLQLNYSSGNTIPSTNNVVINGGILKISQNQTLNEVTVSSGELIIDAGVTLTINGTFTGGGTITNNGTIVLNTASFPGSSSTISSMNNLTIDRGLNAPIILNKSIEVTGTLSLLSGTLDISDKTLTINTSTITRGTGDLAADMGSIIFTNSSPITIPNQTFLNNNLLNLTVNGAGVTTQQSLNITGDLTLTAGTLDIGGTTLNYSGSSISRTSGDIDADAGNLEFANTTALTIPASSIKSGLIKDLTLNGSGGVTISQNTTISSSIAMSNGVFSIGNNTLTLDGNISGTPGNSCYIATNGTGTLKKKFTGTGLFSFPIGDGAYAPISLDFSSGTFNSAYVSVRTDNTKHGSNISNTHYINRHWVVNQTGITGFNCQVVCNYTNGDIPPGASEANIYCGKFNGSIWTLGNLADAANNTLTFSNNTSFSDFTGGELSAMPVSWLFFNCKPDKNHINLNWGVSEEPATGIYTIERSIDGRNWEAIGTKTPSSQSFTTTSYHFTDLKPALQAYYRIKHTENIQDIQYTELCFAQLKPEEKPIIKRDVINNQIIVSLPNLSENTATISLYDLCGKKLKSILAASTHGHINTTDLPPGIYELTIEHPGYRHAEKILIVN